MVCTQELVCKRTEHEVTGLGDGERGFDRLEIAHLADENDVRVLAQHVFQRDLEARGVAAHLALIDDRKLVGVQELDRVLDRHDVLAGLGVDLVDDRGERGRFARPGGPGDEHEPARLGRQLGEDRRQPELVETCAP